MQDVLPRDVALKRGLISSYLSSKILIFFLGQRNKILLSGESYKPLRIELQKNQDEVKLPKVKSMWNVSTCVLRLTSLT